MKCSKTIIPILFLFELIVFRSSSMFLPLIFNLHIPLGYGIFFHFLIVPQQPEQINASDVQSSSLRLAWTLLDPSPGNTTYTIYTYEGTDDNGTSFLKNKSTKVYGMYQFLVVIRIEYILNIASKILVCGCLNLFPHNNGVIRQHLLKILHAIH